MVKIEIKGIEYDMISSFDEMNVETYMKFIQILQSEKASLYKLVDLISLFSGISVDLLKKCNMDAVQNINIEWCFKEMNTELVKEIEIDGEKYKLVDDLYKLTIAEYADLEQITTDKDAKFQNIHKVCAVLYRPINDLEYNYETVEDRAELFLNKLPISIMNPVFVFFLSLSSKF